MTTQQRSSAPRSRQKASGTTVTPSRTARAARGRPQPVVCRRCGVSFADVDCFDVHRHGRGPLGGCTDPTDITDEQGYRAMVVRDGVWGWIK